jgi:hypothetical protein
MNWNRWLLRKGKPYKGTAAWATPKTADVPEPGYYAIKKKRKGQSKLNKRRPLVPRDGEYRHG